MICGRHPANRGSHTVASPAYPVCQVGAGELQGLVAVAHVDPAVEVVDLVRVRGDVHAAEGLAFGDGEADGHSLQRQRLEAVFQERPQLQLEAVRRALVAAEQRQVVLDADGVFATTLTTCKGFIK